MPEKSRAIPLRNEIPASDQWDLRILFETDELWEKAYENTEKRLPEFNKYPGRLKESLQIFKEAVFFDFSISRDIEKLLTYAHLKNDEDKTNQTYQAMFQKIMRLSTVAYELSSFMSPEIQDLPEDIITGYLSDDALKDYQFYFEKILRNKPHTLSKEVEQVLSRSSEIFNTSRQIFGQLDNADLTFGEITDNEGKKIELSHGNFISFLMNPDRDIRKKAFEQYYKSYESHKHTYAAAFTYSLKKDVLLSQTRHFSSCREASLFSDNVSTDVYDNLLKTVKENLVPLFEYLDFRKKILGVENLHIYDTYVPLVKETAFKMSYDEAVDVCIKALSPLGKKYTDVLEKGLRGGWVDRYENKGKRSGAYSSGCYDSLPYILMNYDENNINSLYTLIHEAGHSMHSYYSKKHQPYHYHGYTIFVAEVASTLNETLLGQYLIDIYKDNKQMTAYILNREIDNIRATLYRQTMFAEFELICHDILEKNQPVTLETLTSVYRRLLETYFGESLTIDEKLELECLRIPHFYSPFYVYKYATGISAAIALSRNILSNSQNAVDDYLRFLGLGGSKFPIDELIDAGVDMSTEEPVVSAVNHFKTLINRFISAYESL